MRAVGDVHQAVARDVHAVDVTGQVGAHVGRPTDQERRGQPRRLVARLEAVVGRDAEAAPVALVLAGVRVEDDDALVAVAVGDEHLVGRLVEVDARRPAEQRRIAAAVGPRHVADLQQELPVGRELHDRVAARLLADPDVAFPVDVDGLRRKRSALPLRPPALAGHSPRLQQVAFLVEFEDGRRRLPAGRPRSAPCSAAKRSGAPPRRDRASRRRPPTPAPVPSCSAAASARWRRARSGGPAPARAGWPQRFPRSARPPAPPSAREPAPRPRGRRHPAQRAGDQPRAKQHAAPEAHPAVPSSANHLSLLRILAAFSPAGREARAPRIRSEHPNRRPSRRCTAGRRPCTSSAPR